MFNHAVPARRQAKVNRLTPRELEVLALVVLGCTTPEISERLDLTSDTVKTHLRRLMAKLDAKNRTQLFLRGQLLGLVVVECDNASRSAHGAIVATSYQLFDGTPALLVTRVDASRA